MTTPVALTAVANALTGHIAHTGQPVADVAAELGVSVDTVRAWLSGRRPHEVDNQFDHLDTTVKLGEWLRARIAGSGCTVRELADSTDNVSMGTVYNWLRGEHLPPPPYGQDPDRLDLLLSNPRLGLNLRQRLQLDEIRRRLTGTSTRITGIDPDWQARGLPSGDRSFTGRARELARLNRLLRDYVRSQTVVVATVTGIGGIGKTSLATHWARSRQVRTTFTDGCLFLNLNGYADTPPISPESALAKLLLQLDVHPRDIPADPDARAARYQECLVGRRLLVILDNAHAEPQLRPLLPSAPECMALITSRNRLHGLRVTNTGVTRLPLGTLTTTEAASLLRNLLDRPAIRAAEDTEIESLTDACGQLPLALRIAASNYATHHHVRGTSIGEYATSLTEDRLGHLVVGPSDPATTVTATLDRSYRHLGSTAKQTYRLLGLHPGTDFTAAAAASLTGFGPDQTLAALTELAHANLIGQSDADRYTIHDLLRDHAASLVERVESVEDEAAQRRMVQHYIDTAYQGSLLLSPQRHSRDQPEPDISVTVAPLPDPAAALSWFDTYLSTLVNLVERCAQRGHHASCWRLAWALTPFLDRRAQGHIWEKVQRLALTAAQHRPERAWRAESHRMLGRALISQGQYNEARAHLRDAITGFGELGDDSGQATTFKNLGLLDHRLGRDQAAIEHNTKALECYRRLGDELGEVDTLNNLGWCLAQTGQYQRAEKYCLEALHRYRGLEQHDAEANALDSLGFIAAARGYNASAIGYFHRALALYETLDGHQYETARSHHRLADQLRAADDVELARAHYADALELLERLKHRDADTVRDRVDQCDTDLRPSTT